jgi:hypothetical protein
LSADLLVLLDRLDMLVALEGVDLILRELHTVLARLLGLFCIRGREEQMVNVREALDERVLVRDLAALVFGMLLGAVHGIRDCWAIR